LEGDFALGQRVDNVVSTYTDNKTTTDARIAREEKARADGDSALASIVTSLTTRVGNSEGALVTLEQVNTDLDSSLSEISSKLDNTIQEVSTKASSSALSDLASNVEVLEGSISSTTNSITALENSLETTNTNLNK
jgi:predicted RNase H-like nuclease (RuvC/YqgF family)